jgi:UDP-N-acetylglucosamine 1-carboxyvinyltransferase
MGAAVDVRSGYIHAHARNGRMLGAQVYLDMVSVGATMNVMLAAALADGMTVIENAAKEPHIVDLANFLNSMGANIMGAGTDVIKVRGVDHLRGGAYSIIPDQIEAGTYMAAVAATGGQLHIRNVIPKHLECITAKLLEMGVEVEEEDDAVIVRRTARCPASTSKPCPIRLPNRYAASDCRRPVSGRRTSSPDEGVWDNRYRYVDEFAAWRKDPGGRKVAVIEGVDKLTGAPFAPAI